MWKIILFIIGGLVFIYIVLFAYGSARWNAKTRARQTTLFAHKQTSQLKKFDASRDLKGLPAPVSRYLKKVLPEGQPYISSVRIKHTGTFNMSETGEQWKPFISDQHVVTQRPGFLWDARISMMPGLPIRVHDAYIAGEGILQAYPLGLFPVVNMQNSAELARGELMRYLAESAWYPTALLSGHGIQWEAIDDSSALAVLTDKSIKVPILFHFGEDDLIASVRAEDRGRTVNGQVIPTPWVGEWKNYERMHGLLVPRDGEVLWEIPNGRQPYWRGHLSEISYQWTK